MNNDPLFLIGLRALALRKEVDFITSLRQFTTSAMEHSSIIDSVAVTDVADSQYTPEQYKV
jgi:hypothetical protein